MIQDPIFIVGTERSGSELLRLLLNESDEVAVPNPPHLMRDLAPMAPRYGALTQDHNFRRLIRDAIKLVDLHEMPWPFHPSADEVFENAAKRTLYAICAGIYEQYRAHAGKSRWGCKSTYMINHVSEVLRHHKRPRFIHLVRDPRDMAASVRNDSITHYHPYYVGQIWVREQNLAVKWANKLEARTWYTLRFEDLIAEPAGQMRKLCKFLDIKYSPQILRAFNRAKTRGLATSGKYLGELSVQEILLVESFTRELMIEFDYKPVSESAEDLLEPGPIQQLGFQFREKLALLRGEARAALQDGRGLSRLRKKAFLWRLGVRSSL